MTPICIKHKTKLVSDSLCEVCLEECAIQSALNMGVADYFYCGHCGTKCNPEEVMEHMMSKCYIELVKNGGD